MFQITRATLLDLNALRALEHACFPLDAWPLLDLISVLSMPGVLRLKAVEDEKMIGFVAVDQHQVEGVSWIATICISPEYQGRGYGKALLTAAEQKISTPIIKLCVRIDNEVAIKMYKQFGYQAVDTWPGYYNDGSDSLVMQKYHADVEFQL